MKTKLAIFRIKVSSKIKLNLYSILGSKTVISLNLLSLSILIFLSLYINYYYCLFYIFQALNINIDFKNTKKSQCIYTNHSAVNLNKYLLLSITYVLLNFKFFVAVNSQRLSL